MKEEYKNSAIVKALQIAGFTDESIEAQIESGDIRIEKSKSTAEMDRSEKFQERNIDNDKKHIEDLKKDEKEDEKDKKDLERDKKAHEEKEERINDMEKALSNNLMKSIEELPGAFAVAVAPLFKGIVDRLNSQAEELKKITNQTPDFRGANINSAALIEKSLQKDENGKTPLSITRQRPLVRKLVEKITDTPNLEKSIQDDALAYLMDPDARTVGSNLAMYMYQKENIALEG